MLLYSLTAFRLIFRRVHEILAVLTCGVELRSRRRARGRALDLYSTTTDTFNLPRSWPRVTCKTANGREKRGADPRVFSPQTASSRGRSSTDMMRYKWYVSTCQHGETRPIPDHCSTYNCIRQAPFSCSCVRSCVRRFMPLCHRQFRMQMSGRPPA